MPIAPSDMHLVTKTETKHSYQLVALRTTTFSLHPPHSPFTMSPDTLGAKRMKARQNSNGGHVQFAANTAAKGGVEGEEGFVQGIRGGKVRWGKEGVFVVRDGVGESVLGSCCGRFGFCSRLSWRLFRGIFVGSCH